MRVVNAAAPVRICDLGGWTDTWFSGHGKLLNIAVRPGVEVQVRAVSGGGRVELHVEDFDERYTMRIADTPPGRHPLLEQAVLEADPPRDLDLEVWLHSEVPPGAATGTSAAVCVALLGALGGLRADTCDRHDLANAAHRVETQRLGLQSGIQDQLAAAHGGVSFIDMHAYPHASVAEVRLADAVRWELERRLVLVFLGKSHASSAVHEEVIASLEEQGGTSPHLDVLRRTAERGREALLAGDLETFGAVMADNTQAQQDLHPSLVSSDAHVLIGLAREHGAVGWKVNGAGGEGGSVTILCGPGAEQRHTLLRAIRETAPHLRPIDITLDAEGLRVWEA